MAVVRPEGLPGSRAGGALRRDRSVWRYVLPMVVILGLVTLTPQLIGLVLSFTDTILGRAAPAGFSGLASYERVLESARFWNSVKVQAILTLLTVPSQLLIGAALALYVFEHQGFGLFRLARAVMMLPMIIPPIVAGLTWKVLFNPDISIVNYMLAQVGIGGVTWFGRPTTAIASIAIADTWEWFPFVMIVHLAALETIPEDVLDAARIDTGSWWQKMRLILLPLTWPQLVTAALFRFAESLKAFPLIFMLTDGGPGTATEATNYYAYRLGFVYGRLGEASAISMLVLVVSGLIAYSLILRIGRVEAE